jgi:hypothetical protein
MNDTALLQDLIDGNRHRLVPEGAPLPKIVKVVLGRKQYCREDMYHQSVSIICDIVGKTSQIELWAKHRPGIHETFALLDNLYRRLGEDIFPKPILEWHSVNGTNSLLLMSRVQGNTLRDRLIKAALLRRTADLVGIFASNGAKMRKFHDASDAVGSISMEGFVAHAKALIDRTNFFSAAEKTRVLEHVQSFRHVLLDLPSLPSRKLHHDWTLRNVLVDKNGVDCLIDFDSMRAPASSRWIEVTCFLLNLESQAKWAPIVSHTMLSDLWAAFWQGYVGTNLPECSQEQIPAIFFLARLHHLLGGTFRLPLYEKYKRFIDTRFLSALRKSMVAGEYTTLA